MKEKIFKKYGIIIAIVIWILAILPFIKIFFPAKGKINTSILMNNEEIIGNKGGQEEFILINDYGDPFLKKEIQVKPVISQNKKEIEGREKKIKKETKTVVVKSTPTITYAGIIKNKQDNRAIGMFTINGNDALLAVNQKHEGIILLKLFTDSALVQFDKEKILVRKQG